MSLDLRPSYRDACRFWLRLGFISFGGPTGQIAIMHAELVERKRWISEARFLHALNFCMLLPGPEAQQLAIYTGWLLHKTRGGITAGVLFVLPSVFILWALSFVYVACGEVPWIAAIFYGLKPGVVAIVAIALLRIARRALRNALLWCIAGAAFVAIFFLYAPFPLIVLGAGLLGLLGNRLRPEWFAIGHEPVTWDEVLDDSGDHSLGKSFRTALILLAVWWLPLLSLGGILGWQHTLFREATFFSKAAMLTFGGAYAVLPYVSQQAVETYHWLAPGQMLDGLGLAETTPGPLIMVLQFVGFLGGWNQPVNLPPLLAATLGALVTTWATFAPCFLWVLVGAPYIERLRGNARMSAALRGVTAAIVGVILNLTVWFALQTWLPQTRVVDWFAIILTLLAFAGMLRWKWNAVAVIAGCGIAGVLWNFLR